MAFHVFDVREEGRECSRRDFLGLAATAAAASVVAGVVGPQSACAVPAGAIGDWSRDLTRSKSVV